MQPLPPKCVVTHPHFDWQGDQPLRHAWESTVIYELHLRGFTVQPGSGVSFPSTVSRADRQDSLSEGSGRDGGRADAGAGVQPSTTSCGSIPRPVSGSGTIGGTKSATAFFRSQSLLCRRAGCRRARARVQGDGSEAPSAGIEVILDVVFNHTVEGNELGPTVCLRGIDNTIYYWLDDDKRFYRDFTGTGQTINAAHPVVRDLILDALRYWVMEMHVDGFRFDLASVLGRDRGGHVLADAPLLERIAEDPILRDAKLIAEAWDAAGAYQVGSFSDRRWAEWNGRFRDDVRRFWRGDEGMMSLFASRICGSSDIYRGSGKGPECSINFVTCHDGFTLNDLVSHSHKHNDANGENGRDGAPENYSANYGVEGASDDPAVEAVRVRQIRNFLLTLAISRGVPMLLAGDEFRRSQGGNNNAYCQDNETSWVDWSLLERNHEVFEFARGVFAFRQAHPVLRREGFYRDDEVRWFQPSGESPDWFDSRQKCLACLIRSDDEAGLFLLFNASTQAVSFAVPPRAGGVWRVAIDTAVSVVPGFYRPGEEAALASPASYVVQSRSSVVLGAR